MVRILLLLTAVLALAGSAWGAPLMPEDRQASDALALLREWGVVEGYPEGGFRGDRAVSRWEAATIVARTLAALESRHEPLLTRAQLEELNSLALAYRDELEALGVRVGNLEDQVERLDRRVEELSHITFSGRSITWVGAQSFTNRGQPASGFGPPTDVSGFGPGAINYNSAVGSLVGANLLPHAPAGIVPVIDLVRGQPLTNGAGFASLLYLDTLIEPHPDWSAELRLYAYTSQGDALVDALWGITPPYLANPFTGNNPAGDPQGVSHVPYTQAGLDRLTLVHHPSGVTVTLGTFEPRFISPTVYLGQVNPIRRVPRVLESYGFQVTGDMEPFGWEVFGTRLPDGQIGVTGPPYRPEALGGALTYSNEGWLVGGSFLRAADQFQGGGPLTVGQISRFNGLTGELYGDWVNPNGFFVNQLGGVGSTAVAGSGSTGDKRPVPGNANSDALGRANTFGPQGITLAGLSVEWSDEAWTAFGEYSFSDYKPNRNSSFSAHGDLFGAGLRRRFDDGRIELGAEYRSADATYDPFILTWPDSVAGGLNGVQPLRAYHRLPDHDQFWHMYSLHDTNRFPQNRRGWWLTGTWQYRPDGSVRLAYRDLEQVTTSLQDVRFLPGSLGPGTPNALVLGHSPGFIDVVFREYSPLSFDAGLNPLEDERGEIASFSVEASQVFTGTPWRLDLAYEVWNFDRPTSLPATLGGSQNRVDLTSSVGRFSVGHRFGDNLLLTLGYEQAVMKGHYDPFGTYNPYAFASGLVDFENRDTVQHMPFVEADWNVTADVKLNSELYLYNTVDHVPANVFPGLPNGSQATAHPFSWSGYRLGTTLEVSF